MRQRIFAVILVTSLTAAFAAVAVAEEGVGRGFVDPAPFETLAGEDDLTVYVSIGSTVLRLMAAAMQSQDEELADTIARLDSINAVIVDISKPEKRAAGQQLLRDTVKRLTRKRWERLALVKEEDVELSVLIRGTRDTVDGLVVVMLEKSENQLIFANIAGIIDLAKLEALSRELDIPGLDQVPDER